MIKTEQAGGIDQYRRVVPYTSPVPLPPQQSLFRAAPMVVPRRSIDPRAIDLQSVKGRFAWERIEPNDIYIPFIFRGTEKYFCVKMLQKLLSGYPEDAIHRSFYYQYEQVIDIFRTTPNEVDLLNKINVHHSRFEYSRQPFSSGEELVRVSEFLPFYEHLRMMGKSKPIQRNAVSSVSRSPLLQQTVRRSPDFMTNMSNAAHTHSTTPVQPSSHTTPQLLYENISSISRPGISTSTAPCSLMPSKQRVSALGSSRKSVQQQQISPPSSIQHPTATSSDSTLNSTNKVLPNKSYVATSTSQYSAPITPTLSISSVYSISTEPPSSMISMGRLSTSRPSVPSTSSSTSVSKTPHLRCGWLQINKLYTPYISTDAAAHHLYKIPVSLLTFYDLLKIPSLDNATSNSKDYPSSFEQTLVTPQEIELINELCLKQSIKPFAIDTKLIDLFTFYQHCSTNIVFVKELAFEDPKSSICKDWSSIVQIKGGICRLRNTTTLHEQTVPFIENNLLKNFIISSACLASASLTNPTSFELEFLQLILFFGSIPISLRNAKLIDIESVQKEYNVDLILYFNDKFPLNVLNCQQSNNRSLTSLERSASTHSSAATNMFAESTPPPSPPSPPTKKNQAAKATPPLPSTADSSLSSNRYQKTILFHGYPMTAYICSGLGSDAQRECISVKALCNALYPNSSILDKLEVRLLRLLRMKNISRFRPQNQQSMGFTRLVDVQDVENHWDYIQQGMCSVFNDDEGPSIVLQVVSSVPDVDWRASTSDKLANKTNEAKQETPLEADKVNKRALERVSVDDEVAISNEIDKRIRFTKDEGDVDDELPISTPSESTNTIHEKHPQSDVGQTEEDAGDSITQLERRPSSASPIQIVPQKDVKKEKNKRIPGKPERSSNDSSIISRKSVVTMKKKIRLRRKRSTPYARSGKQSVAAWIQKYDIEECCIRLNACDPMFGIGRHRLC